MIINTCLDQNTWKACKNELRADMGTVTGRTREEAKANAEKRFHELAHEYYTPGFKREDVFVVGNIIETRNGTKWIIEQENLRCKIDNEIFSFIAANEISKKRKRNTSFIYALWDEYCFYGINTKLDIVKVWDCNMNLIAERTEYNELTTLEIER